MRLIDADALMEHIMKDPLFPLVEQYGISGVLNAQPTIDAVPVIRCKDCKWYIKKEWLVGGGYYIMCRNGSIANAKKDDYCSRAERKEE